MDFWAEAKRLSYTLSGDKFIECVKRLGITLHREISTPEEFRDLYRSHVCDENHWPKNFSLLAPNKVREGIEVKSLTGTIIGGTTGNRKKCVANKCPGWFVEIIWETGQTFWPCSEGWHYDSESDCISIIGGGEISARFVTPKPLGRQPSPREEWPSKKELNKMRGWRVSS